MTSLTNTDLTGKGKQQLEGHLKSADFFDVNTYATAYVSINKVLTKKGNLYEVSGDLTIKEITHPVNFSVTILKDKISGKLTFDRTKYNVKFASGSFFENLGDNLINDTITLEINLNKL
jgi:polyisoprenoid-binding protein YceI